MSHRVARRVPTPARPLRAGSTMRKNEIDNNDHQENNHNSSFFYSDRFSFHIIFFGNAESAETILKTD
jgi:hypothetical protein